MKDAYSFDADLEGLDKSYQKMYVAYKNIFDRIGLNYKIVKADTGVMGGFLSEEFQAITDTGEDILVLCDTCEYAANQEISECVLNDYNDESDLLPKELVYTPSHGTIKEICDFLNVPMSKVVKTLIYKVDDEFYACMVAGDKDVNEVKLQKLLKAVNVELASMEDVEKITSAKVGFAGPIGLKSKIVVD